MHSDYRRGISPRSDFSYHSKTSSRSSSSYRSKISLRSGSTYLSEMSLRSDSGYRFSTSDSDFASVTKMSDHSSLMKAIRNFYPKLQQLLSDKHTLIQLAELLNKKDLINMDALATVQAKESMEGSGIILNLLEMKVAQEPEMYEEIVTTMKMIPSLRAVF